MPWELRVALEYGHRLADMRASMETQLIELETLVLDQHPAGAGAVFYTALLDCARSLPSDSDESIVRLFTHLWGIIKEKQRPLTPKAVAVALHVATSSELIDAIWVNYIASGASPDVWAWTAYTRALLRLGRRGEAFGVVKEHIGDDLQNTDAAVALFVFATSDAELAQYATALPRTWASPKVQEGVAKYRRHRSQMWQQ
ncbi:hypothetical protein AURDEDRAFT_113510 [Auricularia subglabra TFB-10046 SS5]|nr:hypothetical protein AURDEDRAFT_113510 [Auricularia subglabra TFB-10046 SS5]